MIVPDYSQFAVSKLKQKSHSHSSLINACLLQTLSLRIPIHSEQRPEQEWPLLVKNDHDLIQECRAEISIRGLIAQSHREAPSFSQQAKRMVLSGVNQLECLSE